MKDTLTAHYHKLSPIERLSLATQAQTRGDTEELNRLRETCPRIQYAPQIDIAYAKKYNTLVTCALIHVGRLYRAMALWLLAQPDDTEALEARLGEINAVIGAWQAFCNEIMQDPVEVLNQLEQHHAVNTANSFKIDGMPNNELMLDALLADYRAAWQHY